MGAMAVVVCDVDGSEWAFLLVAEPLPLVVWTAFPVAPVEEGVGLPFQEVDS